MHFVYFMYVEYFMNFVVCMQVSERPLVQRFEAKTAFFRDGSQAEVDVVVMCTGYLHAYPFHRYPKYRCILFPNVYRKHTINAKIDVFGYFFESNFAVPPNC